MVESPDQRRWGRRGQREHHGGRLVLSDALALPIARCCHRLWKRCRGASGDGGGGGPGRRDLVLRPGGGGIVLALLVHLRVAEDLLDAAWLAVQRDVDQRARRRRRRLRVRPRPPEAAPSLLLPPVPVRRRVLRYQLVHRHAIERVSTSLFTTHRSTVLFCAPLIPFF